MQKTIQNKFYSRGEFQPSFMQGLALGAVIIAGLFAAYLTMSNSDDKPIQETEAPIEESAQTSTSIPEQDVKDIKPENNISPIENSEPEVKKVLLSEDQAIEKIPELSPRPLIQEWISTEEYIRKTIALIDNISQDKFPKKDLAQFFLDDKFKVAKEGDNIILDTTGYERFNIITESIVSINSD